MRYFKIETDLSPADLKAFQELAADKGVSLDRLWTWLRQHKYKVSRGAVHNWRRHYRRLLSDPILRMRAALIQLIETIPADRVRDVYRLLIG